MKKYFVQPLFLNETILGSQLNSLEEKLNRGWKIERVDSAGTDLIYILCKEEPVEESPSDEW